MGSRLLALSRVYTNVIVLLHSVESVVAGSDFPGVKPADGDRGEGSESAPYAA